MTLTPIRYWDPNKGSDVRAWTDGYACDEDGRFVLLSLVGPDSAVRALSAAAMTGCQIDVMENPKRSLFASYWERYRIRSTRLACGYIHQIVLARSFLGKEDARRLLYVGNRDRASLVFEALLEGLSVPLLPEWKERLYRRLLEEGLVEDLQGTVPVLRLHLNEEAVSEMVSEGVRTNALSI